MPLTRLFQHRLLLMVFAEVVVVVLFVAAAWHVWQSRQGSLPPCATSLPGASSPDRAPLRPRASAAAPSPSVTASPAARPSPGFRTDGDFLARQMGDINHNQSALERVEWRIVKAAIDGMRRYLEHIVLPAVERAERGGG